MSLPAYRISLLPGQTRVSGAAAFHPIIPLNEQLHESVLHPLERDSLALFHQLERHAERWKLASLIDLEVLTLKVRGFLEGIAAQPLEDPPKISPIEQTTWQILPPEDTIEWSMAMALEFDRPLVHNLFAKRDIRYFVQVSGWLQGRLERHLQDGGRLRRIQLLNKKALIQHAFQTNHLTQINRIQRRLRRPC